MGQKYNKKMIYARNYAKMAEKIACACVFQIFFVLLHDFCVHTIVN